MSNRQPKLIKPPDMNPRTHNPFFTPWYLNNLLEANNNVVNAKVINHIRDLYPNETFRDILLFRAPWARDMLINRGADQSMAYFNATNPTFLYQGPEPNDLNQYLYFDDTPGERPEEPDITFRDDEYINRPSGPSGSGLRKTKKTKKTKENKWIIHVKTFAKTHKIPYNIALQQAKASYHS